MHCTENLHSAIGELAYAIARADGTIQEQERETFQKLIAAGLRSGDADYDVSDVMFQIMAKDRFADTETAYKWAIEEIRMNSHYLSPELKEAYINIIEAIARAFPPVTGEETVLIERFKKDIEPLHGDPVYYAKKKTEAK